MTMLTFAVVGFAGKSKPAPDIGEGLWGINGTALVNVFGTNVHQQEWASSGGGSKAISGIVGPRIGSGNLRNVTPQPLKNIVITVGEIGKDDTVVYGTDSLKDDDLRPNEIWRWSVDPNKGDGYEILRVSVDGHSLTRMSP